MCLPGPQGPLRLQFPAPLTNPLFNPFFLCPLLREWREESLIFLAEDTFLSAHPPTTNRTPPSHRQANLHRRPPHSTRRLQIGSRICLRKKVLANRPLHGSKQLKTRREALQTGEPFAFSRRSIPGFKTNHPPSRSAENRKMYPRISSGFSASFQRPGLSEFIPSPQPTLQTYCFPFPVGEWPLP
jgi:hypothetical protein